MAKYINRAYENHKPEFKIYEGLITSHPLYRVMMILSKKLDVKPNYKSNTFILQYQFNKMYEDAKLEINKILQLTNNLGWFPSYMSSYDAYGGKFEKLSWDETFTNFKKFILNDFTNIMFSFEAKYDIPFTAYPDIMYHVCRSKDVDKILAIGLVPRSRSKKAFHPERVYLCKYLNNAINILNSFSVSEKDKYEILEICTIPMYEYLKLYQDPNFMDQGYYTLNNIPRWCISRLTNLNYENRGRKI